jgi:hypothetical protein
VAAPEDERHWTHLRNDLTTPPVDPMPGLSRKEHEEDEDADEEQELLRNMNNKQDLHYDYEILDEEGFTEL